MVHTFKAFDRWFMLDSDSGSLYQIDELTKKLIDKKNSPDEFSEGDFSRYSKEEVLSANAEIDILIKEEVLFTTAPVVKPIENNGIIKSMCLNISHKCNLRCGYCFADGGSYYGEAMNMPLDTAKAAVDFLISRSGTRKVLEIDFFGGEPLLNIDVVKKTIAYAREKEKSIDKKFRFTITTNALGLSDEIIDFFNAEMFNVVVSMDGRRDVHNAVRKTVSGKDSFDIILANSLNFAKKRGDKQYYIRGTFTSQNKDFSKDVIALNDYGFKQLSLEPVVLDNNHPLSIKESDLDELCTEYEILAKEYIERRKHNTPINFFHFNLDLEGGPCETKRIKSCGAGCEYVAITPSGDIYPCHQFAGNNNYKIGNILDGTYDNSFEKLFEQNSIFSKPECVSCWAKYYCSGGCAANSVNLHSDLSKNVHVACTLMKKRLECALAIYSIENEQI